MLAPFLKARRFCVQRRYPYLLFAGKLPKDKFATANCRYANHGHCLSDTDLNGAFWRKIKKQVSGT